MAVQTKTFVRTLRGLENEFGFKITETKAIKKTAYPKIYGLEFVQDDIETA